MIKNISYNNPEVKDAVNNAVGLSYGLIDRVRMGGIGSRRMLITGASPNIMKWLELQNTAPYCYLELRPRGIIVHFRSVLETMGWIVPFHHLSVFRNGTAIHLHAAGEFMRIRGAGTQPPDYRFIEKILERKRCLLEEA